MSENHQSWTWKSFFKIGAIGIFVFFLFARIGYGQNQTNEKINQSSDVILQGSIQIQSVSTSEGNKGVQIQPGTPVKISIKIENKGNKSSPPGELYVRYAFADPLDKETTSVLFETERKPLPSIEPDKSVEIVFDKTHHTPSLLDFVRDDWSMREYQAIAEINEREYMIGTIALTFSAYYYPAIIKEFPNPIHSMTPSN